MNAISIQPHHLHFHPPRPLLDDLLWYCAATHWGEEHIARDDIAEIDGMTPWLPVEVVTVRPHRGSAVERIRPLFPGYILVGLEPGMDIGPAAAVRSIREIRRPVGAPEPTPLHKRAIKALTVLWDMLDDAGGWIDRRPKAQPISSRRGTVLTWDERGQLANILGMQPQMGRTNP